MIDKRDDVEPNLPAFLEIDPTKEVVQGGLSLLSGNEREGLKKIFTTKLVDKKDSIIALRSAECPYPGF